MRKVETMSLDIRDIRSISELKQEFSSVYPYLRIEFYKKRLKKNEANMLDKILPADLKLKEIRSKHHEGVFSLHPERTITDIENELEQKYGLHSQIFRKSGNIWIETTLTGKWSLRMQNREGYEISKELPKRNPFSELADAIDSE